jgi:hypothetical protein
VVIGLVVVVLSPPRSGIEIVTPESDVVVGVLVLAGGSVVVVVELEVVEVGARMLLTSEPSPPNSDVKPPIMFVSVLLEVVVGAAVVVGGSLVVLAKLTGPVGASKMPEEEVGLASVVLDGAAVDELESADGASEELVLLLVGCTMIGGSPLEEPSADDDELLDGDGGATKTELVITTVVTPESDDACTGGPTWLRPESTPLKSDPSPRDVTDDVVTEDDSGDVIGGVVVVLLANWRLTARGK